MEERQWARGMIGGKFVKQQITVAKNAGEHIVTIVRDTAGEPNDGLHFLRLAQPFLSLVCFLLRFHSLRQVFQRDKDHVSAIHAAHL